MKKSLSILTILLIGSSVFAAGNLPSAPTYGTPKSVSTSSPSSAYKKNVTSSNYSLPSAAEVQKNLNSTSPSTSSSGSSVKSQLDGIAMSILKAGERHDDAGVQAGFQKMMKMGVTAVNPPQILSKQTPKCPPIKISVNGRTLSGSRCALMGYEYNGKHHDVGYCR